MLTVNGTPHPLPADSRTSLLDHLRDNLGHTGPKKGCDQGGCGACTVILDGQRVLGCLTLAAKCEGARVTTIEGLAEGETLHPLQAAFIEHDGFQCGYCTPGQICSAIAMAAEVRAGIPSRLTPMGAAPELSDEEIRERLSGNICRCGAYNGIVAAVRDAFGQGGPA